MKMVEQDGISEELRSIIENTNDLMFVKNRNSVYIAASKNYALDCVRCNGVEEVIGKDDFALFKDQELAAKYRADDIALFESGKAMIEFEEEYPNKDGSKNRCLTTKYLLHDKDGKPVAIFGQYHDIGKQAEREIARRRDINRHVADALSKSFVAANYADLVTHKYVTIQSREYARKMVESCETIEQAFETFIQTLVKEEFQDKMREFCQSDTIAERIKGEKRIDCEYLSNVASGWCRASFYPAEWDADGTVTHVLFAVSSIDEEKSKEIEESIQNKRDIETIFDEVPGGIVQYRWDGKELKILKISKYYKDLYGNSMLNDTNSPDFVRIHPDDIADYQAAIYKALTETYHLEYVFRSWNMELDRYVWVQINAISKPQEDGTSLVYAIYTDVTLRMQSIQNYKDRVHALEKSNEDALCMYDINLTKDTFSNIQSGAKIKSCSEQANTIDEFIQLVAEAVLNPDERKEYLAIFNRKNLLEQFENGERSIKFEHFYQIDEKNTSMVVSIVELFKEPVSDEVIGICYAKDMNISKISKILLNAALEKDYPMAALVYADTGEYYLYEVERGAYCVHKQNYWEEAQGRIREIADKEVLTELCNTLTAENILSELKDKDVFSYAFYGSYRGTKCRLEVRFRYFDRIHHLMIATLRNITDEELYEQYKYESMHDALTGLYNRNAFFKNCRELLDTYPGEQFVMLHLDIRHFHLYNTFFGEEAGNHLLCTIAKVLRRMGAEYDYIAYGRIDADVFGILFPVERGLFEKHVRSSFETLEEFSPDFPLELAVGAYWVVDAGMSIEAMFSRATIAAKSHKKNLFDLISRYDESMEQNLKNTHQITSEMIAAIEQEQFKVYLQPKYSLQSEKMVGAEALVRWKHPVHGMISPGRFIPVFEQNGFIANLDRYMWEHVCQILRAWKDEGKTLYPVSVNLSRVSMYSHATVPFLKELIEKYQLDPKYLELELTESAYMDDPEDLKRMLKDLQNYGFHILIDDFGSGYSSLNTLRELPVDILKLDMKFLSDTQNDPRANAVLSSVVRMSKLLHLPIVAEGVEKREQADYLRDIGCEYVQGFLFAKPMPVEEYEELLDKSNSAEQSQSVALVPMMKDEDFNRKTMEILSNRMQELEKENEQLKHKLTFLESAIDNMPNPVFMKDRDGRFVFFNDSYAECFNMQKEKYIGGTVLDLEYLPEEDRRKYQEEDINLIQSGEISSYNQEYVFNDGKVHSSLYWSKGFLCPDNGERGLIGEIVDISGERRVSENLSEIVYGTAYLFEKFYVVDLENGEYSKVDKQSNGQRGVMISASSEVFFQNAIGRFYNPLNKHLLNYCFTIDGLQEMLKDRDDYYIECKDKLQEDCVFGATIYCIERKNGKPVKVIYALRDITETKLNEYEYHNQLKKANEKLKDIANRDPLTGLYNRRGLMEYVNTQLTEDSRIGLMLIDVDEFKSVNDVNGHSAGDVLLKRVAQLLKETFRSNDVFVRLGGDEFLILFIDCDYNRGRFVSEKIKGINEKLVNPETDMPIGTLSAGVAFSKKGETQELYERADAALYKVKQNGRCGCCIYEEVFEA